MTDSHNEHEHALLSMDPDAVEARRRHYYLNGYLGVIEIWNPDQPVKHPGKQPKGDNWHLAAKKHPPDAVRHRADTRALNTGFTTGSFVAVDIDVPIAGVVDEISAMVEAIAGPTPLSRIGQAPKIALCYRSDRPYRKLQTKRFGMPDSSEAKVEILADGQQLVVDGIHPVTQAPYAWPDQHPYYTPLCELPELTKDAARAVIDGADRILRAAGALELDRSGKTSATEPGASPGEGFFRQVNSAALQGAAKWIHALFPKARQSPNGAWRVKPQDRGRPDLEEEISIHPELGIVDYGLERNMTPLDVVLEFGEQTSALEAALWLCARLGVDPARFGYRNRRMNSGRREELIDASPGGGPEGGPPPGGGEGSEGEPAPELLPGPGSGSPAGLPVIRVRGGKRHIAADQGLAAMRAVRTAFYRRDKDLVRVSRIPTKDKAGKTMLLPGVEIIDVPMLGRALGLSARWEKVDNHGLLIAIDPPEPVVKQILRMTDEWPFPVLAGVIGTPTLRPDFSLLAQDGYDAATGLYLLSGGLKLPLIPSRPTSDDAVAAFVRLDHLLEGFAFANPESRGVAMSLFMTAVLRGAFPVVPLHLIDAPSPGSGKSYLADIAAIIATGEGCAVFAQGEKLEETEKRLIGGVLSGFPIINLDNCRKSLKGDFLCQVTERPLMALRPLGTSDIKRVINNVTMIATGNNTETVDDMVRRVLRCALDANMERPEDREFAFKPDELVRADRGRYVADVLTIALAYVAAGMPRKPIPLPSFAAWSDLVRGSLLWVGCSDPVETMQSVRDNDPVAVARADVFAAWAEELGRGKAWAYQTADLIAVAESTQPGPHDGATVIVHPKLHRALLTVAAGHGLRATKIDNRNLGNWLRYQKGRISEGIKLMVDYSDKKRPKWYLEKTTSEM
jgi:hypothetical protein